MAKGARCPSWPWWALTKRERETCWHLEWVIEKTNKPGKICWTSSKGEGSKRLTSGSVMATRRCSTPSPRSFRTPLVSAVWFTRWTTWLRYVPTKQQEKLKPELKALFYQKDRQAADQAVAAFVEKYRSVYPTAIACLQRDLEACLTFYTYPKEHWKTIRTNNIIERLFGEVKRRSHKMAAAFRNEGSCLLLFYAVIRSLHFNKLTMPASSTKQPDAEIVHNS